MSNEKFKVKFGLAVGDTSATIDAATGNIVTAGDAAINGSNITTTTTTFNVINTNATTVNAFGAATTLNIGNSGGSTNVNGDLDVKGGDIQNSTGSLTLTSTGGSANVVINPGSGTTINDGHMILGQLNTAAILTTNGTGNLDIRTGSWPTSANITLADGVNGNITVDTDGTGQVVINADVDVNGTIYLDQLQVDNININGNTISSTDTNGNIILTPNGTGIIMANAGVQSTRSLAAGNAAIGSSGQIGTVATFDATGATSGAVMQLGVRSENVTTGFAVTTSVIDHGENRSGGGPTTSGNPNMFMESTRGTAAAPTATGSADTLGSLNFAGHDGVRGLGSQVNGASVQLIGVASQAFLNNGTFTTQAGATTILRSQPNNLRLTSNSRQNLLRADYIGGTTNTPPTQSLQFNSISMTTQYDTAGNAINGHGRQDITFYHPTMTILGVPAESTANADNSTLPGSNVITFATSRQSGWSGRRDLVESGDTLAQIRVFGQTTNNSTGNGSQTGTIEFDAAETFSTTRRGSVFKIQTGEIGAANVLSNRLSLDSDNATFSTTRTRFVTPGTVNYGGEISQKVGILNGATSYDKTTELSVTALTIDGTSNATYETKTLRSTDGVNYTPTQSGDVLGRFTFLGNYATATAPLVSNAAGNILVSATENFTSGASGAAMKFNVNKIGTNTNISVLDLAPAASTFRSDAFTIEDSTGTDYAVFDSTKAQFKKPVQIDGSTSGSITLSAGATPATQSYTLPTAYPTANNQVLVSTTGGVTSWASTNSLAANYLDANWTTAIGTLTANTIYGVPLTSLSATNITIATGAIPIDNATATGPTRITFAQTGRYNLQFSIQLANADSAEQDLDVWLRKNTTDVADSNTQITVIKQQGGNPGKNIMALNLLLNVTSVGDYYELVYATTDPDCKPETIAGISTPYVRPQTPSIIVTVTPVGA